MAAFHPLRLFSWVLILVPPAFSNPVDIPYRTDFTGEFDDFYAPTRGGYNWTHHWRLGKYQSWVTDTHREVTASMQARSLAGKSFEIRSIIEPRVLVGDDHAIGFGACGSNRTFGSYYLADVKPAAGLFRILKINGGTTSIAAEEAVGFPLGRSDPFELILTGEVSGEAIRLTLTLQQGARRDSITGRDERRLRGTYFGLRGRSGASGNFEFHFDEYLLDRFNRGEALPVPGGFAPVGEIYEHIGNGTIPVRIPAWARLTESGGFAGLPGPTDHGLHEVRYPAQDDPFVEALETMVVVPAPDGVIISEFMADNDDTLSDVEGDSPDWIELFNPTSSPVDLSGWHLSDNRGAPRKWEFPAGTTLAPLEFRILWASGKELPEHLPFRLDADAGSYLALFRPDGSMASEFDGYPDQREDVSYGVYDDYSRSGYLAAATPGEVNAHAGFRDFTEAVRFSVERGFFERPFTVELSCATPGATIVTTTDGTEPTPANGTPLPSSATITVSGTTILRAAAYAPDLVPSPVQTQTYLFLDDVKTQDASQARAEGWPAGRVNGQVFDYGMDPEITAPLSDEEFRTALMDIPSLSFVTDLAHFNDPVTGFWVNAENRGRAWERPLSVELLNPDGSEGFHINAGVRMRGGFSRQGSNPKHSFRLYFRSEYGAGKLHYPLFGDDGASEFDALSLRTSQGGGGSWHFSASPDATFNRDVFARETQRDLGQPHTRSRYYHLYLNGQYFGLFQSQEHPEAGHAATYFGGEKSDYDVIKTRTKPHRVEALDGDPAAWGRLYDAAVAGFASDAPYFAVQGLDASGQPDPTGENLVDLDNLIDYMLVIFFTGQTDGPVNLSADVPKNFFAFRPRDGSTGFRFLIHDNEDSLRSAGIDVTGNNQTGGRLTYFNPKWLHQQLDDHPRYRRRFADRVHRHFFHGGPLTVARNQERFQASASLIEEAVIGESARWGDFRRNPPYTRANWQGAVDRMLSNWFPSRSGTVLSQLRNRGLYPDTAAPVFNQHGGQVPEGFLLTLDAPEGEIYYTLDGSDPDGPGGILLGGASTTETLIAARSPGWRYLVTARAQSDSGVVVGHPEYDVSDWKHPSFDDQSWPTGQAPLGYGGVGDPGWATEISDGGTLPRNRTTYLRKSFSVSNAESYSALKVNIRRDDGAVVYLNGREIARSNMPDGVIAYADTALAGVFGSGESSYYEETVTLLPGALTEGSNTLAVEIHQESDSSSDLVIDVELLGVNSRDRAPRIVANTRVKARALHEGEWSALNEATFYVTSPASASNLAISEIHYHPAEPGDGLEYLELQNISDQESIHLDGLSFTAGITFTFPEGTTLAPGERLLVVENRTAFEAAYGPGLPVAGEYARRLSNGGETIALGEFLSVSYEDRLPWSELADGSGRSLVFTGGDPNDPARWRASAVEGGTPGGSDTVTFAGDDFPGYAFGDFGPGIGPGGRFSASRHLGADDLSYHLESSRDLASWEVAEGWKPVGETILDGPFVMTHWENPGKPQREFLRVRAVRTGGGND